MTFTDPNLAADYVLAGNATFTVKSLASGEHYTFRMSKAEDNTKDLWFVSLLTIGDVFTYMGVVEHPRGFRLTKKSTYLATSKPVVVFEWFFRNVIVGTRLPSLLEVRHEGTCGKCARPLTHPESIDRGLGPKCAKQRVCEAA